jgi:hypothetical protein
MPHSPVGRMLFVDNLRVTLSRSNTRLKIHVTVIFFIERVFMNTSTEDFKNDYLNGESRTTESEFIHAKMLETKGETIVNDFTFPFSVLNPFTEGLKDLDKDDTDKDNVHYAVGEMLELWDSIIIEH